jgi:hypothetical protein
LGVVVCFYSNSVPEISHGSKKRARIPTSRARSDTRRGMTMRPPRRQTITSVQQLWQTDAGGLALAHTYNVHVHVVQERRGTATAQAWQLQPGDNSVREVHEHAAGKELHEQSRKRKAVSERAAHNSVKENMKTERRKKLPFCVCIRMTTRSRGSVKASEAGAPRS